MRHQIVPLRRVGERMTRPLVGAVAEHVAAEAVLQRRRLRPLCKGDAADGARGARKGGKGRTR